MSSTTVNQERRGDPSRCAVRRLHARIVGACCGDAVTVFALGPVATPTPIYPTKALLRGVFISAAPLFTHDARPHVTRYTRTSVFNVHMNFTP